MFFKTKNVTEKPSLLCSAENSFTKVTFFLVTQLNLEKYSHSSCDRPDIDFFEPPCLKSLTFLLPLVRSWLWSKKIVANLFHFDHESCVHHGYGFQNDFQSHLGCELFYPLMYDHRPANERGLMSSHIFVTILFVRNVHACVSFIDQAICLLK